MDKIIGFIGGSGNMGSAIIGGILKAQLVPSNHIIATAVNMAKLEALKEKYGVAISNNNLEAARKADILFLAVKPNMYAQVIEEIKDEVKEETVIVAIAAGKDIATIEGLFGKKVKVVRSMPNTPALVGEAMSAICHNDLVTKEELEDVKAIFNSIGKAEIVGEYLMDAVTGVSGSSPAYVYMFIEAMADAAVLGGMPRNLAYEFAAQSVLGAAKMVLETGMHPGALKDMVTSPAGTTIEAIAELERKGMRSAVISAVDKCITKSKAMSK